MYLAEQHSRIEGSIVLQASPETGQIFAHHGTQRLNLFLAAQLLRFVEPFDLRIMGHRTQGWHVERSAQIRVARATREGD